ncbi:MAG: Hsp20/alpha crystallin family protein [Deltaproteobacteria bacterium]|nr:MAG: Hsp20/alpha crystallin family protein [Deltaproteobacteria bacterium]UCH07503.1 MAG: Hsp20/alpha crystallin family protein [Deltaproteobacteria bacterium]
MDLVPWRPFGGELSSLRREMDRMWDRFFGETPLTRRIGEEWWPSVDMSETKDNYVVKAELPGLEANDVDVSISGDVLTIKGEKKKEEEEKDEHHHYVERYYGSFQRSFRLPANVKSDKIDASFDKGVLKVTLPKVEEAKKKKIEVKVKQEKKAK